MRIVFLSGGPREGALRYLLERAEPVVAVMTPHPTASCRFRGVIETAEEFGVPVLHVKKSTVTATLRGLSPDLLISCGFSYLLDSEAISLVRYAINVHPTLLPKYRGARSGPYVVINGEGVTGVTVHLITPGIDDGPIIAQQTIPVTPFDTPRSLFRKCREVEPALLYGVIEHAKRGSLQATEQDESQATSFLQLRTPADSVVDWTKPLRALYDEIRACDPEDYPAHFFVDGQKVCIKIWRPIKPGDEPDTI